MRLPQGARLEIILSGAVSLTELNYESAWDDNPGTPDGQQGTSNGATAVIVIPSGQPSGVRRDCAYLAIYNADNAQATVTIRQVKGATTTIVQKVAMEAGDMLEYSKLTGWKKNNSAGINGTTATTDSSSALSAGVSAGTRASVADSKAVSDSVLISATTSSVASNSLKISTADSKGTSAGTQASTADSKAVSGSLNASTGLSTAGSAGTAASVADSKAVSDSVLISSLTSRVSSKGG